MEIKLKHRDFPINLIWARKPVNIKKDESFASAGFVRQKGGKKMPTCIKKKDCIIFFHLFCLTNPADVGILQEFLNEYSYTMRELTNFSHTFFENTLVCVLSIFLFCRFLIGFLSFFFSLRELFF
jgi:hypothetical protein